MSPSDPSRPRRWPAVVGALVAVGAVVVSGLLITDPDGVVASLGRQRVTASPSPTAPPPEAVPAPVALDEADLLEADQLRRLEPRRTWRVVETATKATAEQAAPCGADRFADPESTDTLQRGYESGGRPAARIRVVQASELSGDVRAARAGFRRLSNRFASCAEPGAQLLDTREVTGVGNRAMLFVVRAPGRPAAVRMLGVARTGRVVTTTWATVPGPERPRPAAHAQLLAAAVNGLCGAPGAGRCAAPPTALAVPPLPVDDAPGMLSLVDLPPTSGSDAEWVSSRPRKATLNPAASSCDGTTFDTPFFTRTRTRTFLKPDAKVPDTFGLSQTVGVLPLQRAERFVARVRERVDACVEESLGTRARSLIDRRSGDREITAWRLQVEVGEDRAVEVYMAIMRDGAAVAQLGWVPSSRVTLVDGDFEDLAERALARLGELPAPTQQPRPRPADDSPPGVVG